MGDPRVYFAAVRTLLAWVRTAIAVIGLGFLVARFGLFQRPGSTAPASTAIGVGLIALGAVTLGMVETAWPITITRRSWPIA